MDKTPFMDDPRRQLSERIALAVASPIEEVRAIHLRAAEHLAELANVNGLPMAIGDRGKISKSEVQPAADDP